MRKLLFVVLCCSWFAIAQSEGGGNPVTGTAKNIFQRQQKTLIAAAEQMPGEKYDYKPTAQQNSFGQTVAHVIGSNYVICSKFNDSTAPAMDTLPKATDPKDKLVAALKQSVDFCNSALDSLTDSKLGDQVTLFRGMKVPRAYALFALTDDFADHYAAMAMYMRLNGILPPSAQPRPAQGQGGASPQGSPKPPR
ncbi:MAG TPA: DinB family protein [Terriglobales bacterium]|nr:DinB family protein [Terriglobales bacterium]